MPPSAGYDFVMHPHEHFELALGFLDFEPRGQFEARQALEPGVAGECRCSRIVLGSLVSAVEDVPGPAEDIPLDTDIPQT